jgi:outer membrane biosynthesis protein TonB
MPERRDFIYSATLHLLVVLSLLITLPSLFNRPIDEEPPIVVQLVNLGPKTMATQRNLAPPVPDKPVDVPTPAQKQPTPPMPPAAKTEPPPPPPPVPKPAEVKLPEPKPALVKPEDKPQPPEPLPKQKQQEIAFDALLKNLAAKKLPQQTVQQASTKPQQSSQPVAPLGSQLSVSELDLVRQQIEQCWNPPAGARDAKNLTPEFRVMMNPDGTVRSAQQLNPERNSDPFFQAAADSARRALANPSCQPLKLPPDKYDQWQTFTITFDPKDIS